MASTFLLYSTVLLSTVSFPWIYNPFFLVHIFCFPSSELAFLVVFCTCCMPRILADFSYSALSLVALYKEYQVLSKLLTSQCVPADPGQNTLNACTDTNCTHRHNERTSSLYLIIAGHSRTGILMNTDHAKNNNQGWSSVRHSFDWEHGEVMGVSS